MADYYYKSNNGTVIDFHSGNIFSDEHWAISYGYDSEIENGVVTELTAGNYSQTVDVWFSSDSAYTTAQIRNSFHDAIDRDVQNMTPGRLYIGDYYLECYLTGLTNPEASIGHCKIHSQMTIVAGGTNWRKETTLQFSKDVSSEAAGGIDFPFDYPFDYKAKSSASKTIKNEYANAADFVITIYGSATNPSIIIGGHTYQVNVALADTESLIINSADKTIVKIGSDRSVTNVFGYRYKAESAFEKIPAGISSLVWSGSFGFDLTLIDSRREPLFVEPKPSEDDSGGTVIDETVYLVTSDGDTLTDEYGNYLIMGA